ncbi:MAG: DUF2029 domain-containing protein [Acidobacteria bacterium]|nr:DUF2029 domain-containing protein [Acidobacteriota bacterium]
MRDYRVWTTGLPLAGLADALPHRSFIVRASAKAEAWAVPALLVLFLFLHAAWFVDAPGDLDAFNFALGVRRFDVAAHQPHPPGAPVYIVAGKAATWLWRSLGMPVHPLAGPEAPALGLLSMVTGALSIVLLWRLIRRAGGGGSARARCVTLVVASAPLLWMLAACPLSDVPGLFMILGAYLLMARGQITAASIVAGIAVGVRVQTALLTVPALLVVALRTRSRREAAVACGSFGAGVALWLVPLLASVGPRKYWIALTEQTRHDWSNPMMLAAAPSARQTLESLGNTFVRPWGSPALAAVILAAAVYGAVRLLRASPRRALGLAICAVPYLLFHLIFQETATTRYALPVIVSVAYLVGVSVEAVPRVWREAVVLLLACASLLVSAQGLSAYARDGAPAMRVLSDMHQRASEARPAFVTGHRNLLRIHEILPSPPPWHMVWSRARRARRALVEHWARGNSTPVWFLANPQRTDLALFDRRSQSVLGAYELDVRAARMLGGLRPRAVRWLELRPPAWIAVQGFALTPEINDMSERRREGPSWNGAIALIRRVPKGAVLAVAGRHVGPASDPPVRVVIEVDGRPARTLFANARERHYRALVHLRPDQLAGNGPYATVSIRSAPDTATDQFIPVTVEHFDYQPDDGTLFTFASGWHEPELDRRTGRTWRWASRRATMLVHRRPGTEIEFELSGSTPRARHADTAEIQLVSGNRVLARLSGGLQFSRRVVVPSDVSQSCDIEVAIESASWFVPYETGESADQRELAVQVFHVETGPSKDR